MKFLYSIGIGIYYVLILFSSFFNKKAKRWVIGRRNVFSELEKKIRNESEIVWFHCASLGEFEQGRPVIESYRKAFVHKKILLTFFSPSGYEIRKNYSGANWVFYLPIDFKSNAKRFLDIVNPVLIIFVKYEFWLHYISEIHKRKIPLYLISANFRTDQLFFKKYGFEYRKILFYFNHIFVQNELSKNLLNSIGIYSVSISGDTRFDRVYDISLKSEDIDGLDSFCRTNKVFIAGSIWPADEDVLIPFINTSTNKLKFIVAPHEINENALSRFEKKLNIKHVRFSVWKKTHEDAELLIIDNIGMLSKLYKYGQIAYIGGGFGKGIHNILEAAVFGQPIIFGPNYSRFSEAVMLLNLKGAFSINDKEQLIALCNQFIENFDFLNSTSIISSDYIKLNTGATEKILKQITQ
jgi:3-deoxy-D-manno-octulosonic-acid transferase